MNAAEIDLKNMLKFSPELGLLKLGNQRNLLFSQDAFAKLRRLMFDQLGSDLARSMLTRFGYQNGAGDFRTLNQIFQFASEDERLRAGPIMHGWSGIVRVEPTLMEMDRKTGHFHFKGIWRNSYEAEIHLKEFGLSPAPVCHTLTGYGSGWCSEFFGIPLLEIETKCVACGDLACEWEIRPYRDWGPEARSYVQAMRGDQISIARQLEDQKREVEKLNQSLETRIRAGAQENARLLGVLCHDLKAPLAVLKHAVSKLSTCSISSATTSAEIAIASVENIIKHLDLGSNPESSSANIFRPTETKPAQCIDVCHEMFRLQIEDKRLKFSIEDRTNGQLLILTDPIILTHNILSNLIHNAIKYCPVGGQLHCSVSTNEDGLVVQIADSGIGIPSKFVRAFNMGKEIPGRHGLRGEKSTGLGLNYVRNFVGQIGASISISSKTVIEEACDHGTTVSILFPNELVCDGGSYSDEGP